MEFAPGAPPCHGEALGERWGPLPTFSWSLSHPKGAMPSPVVPEAFSQTYREGTGQGQGHPLSLTQQEEEEALLQRRPSGVWGRGCSTSGFLAQSLHSFPVSGR